ncbi:hypothetical protein OUZ56_019645 [Daphnia magna]|uniref:Uncharacterized protein n=1 Tax=Daphnia magna TaxID=35525 RepID=A0ABQ9ZC88_9CRUS|nr:hypothetical protein OUZ56_019645 [Daphnia magna]
MTDENWRGLCNHFRPSAIRCSSKSLLLTNVSAFQRRRQACQTGFQKKNKKMKMSGTTGDSILETLRADLALSLIPSSLFFAAYAISDSELARITSPLLPNFPEAIQRHAQSHLWTPILSRVIDDSLSLANPGQELLTSGCFSHIVPGDLNRFGSEDMSKCY